MRELTVGACIIAAAVLMATRAHSDPWEEFSVVESLTELEIGWASNCVTHSMESETKRCVEIARQAVGTMHRALDIADRHEALKLLFVHSGQACSDELEGAPRGLGDRTMSILSECVVGRFGRILELKGGLLGYLEWYATIGDLEV